MGIVISLPLVLREHFLVENPIAIVARSAAAMWPPPYSVARCVRTDDARRKDTTPVVTACYGSLQPIFAGIS